MKVQLNKLRIMIIDFEASDQCLNCQNARRCPLIRYIKADSITLRYRSFYVKNCGLYIKEDKCQR